MIPNITEIVKWAPDEPKKVQATASADPDSQRSSITNPPYHQIHILCKIKIPLMLGRALESNIIQIEIPSFSAFHSELPRQPNRGELRHQLEL